MKYIVQEFNKNSLKIEFRMGTYDGSNEEGLVVYAPARLQDGAFDEKYMYNEETYGVTTKQMVVMGIESMSGEYTPLPNIGLASYDFTINFLVYADSPIYRVILMAIREIRDTFIGKVSSLEVEERDVDNLSPSATLEKQFLNIVTFAQSIDMGSPMEIRKKTYLVMSFPLTIIVSKNVEFGNQFVWKMGKVVRPDTAVPPSRNATLEDFDVNVESLDGSIWKGTQLALEGTWEVVSNPGGTVPSCESCPPTSAGTIESYCSCDGTYYQLTSVDYAYGWEFVSVGTTKLYDVIPLLVGFGTAQDQESFQTLRSYNSTPEYAMEIHNYVKSRGYAVTFTFLFNFKDFIIKEMFKESFEKKAKPDIYKLEQSFKAINDDGTTYFPDEMKVTRWLIAEECKPSDISYNAPVVFAIGFSPSAKRE